MTRNESQNVNQPLHVLQQESSDLAIEINWLTQLLNLRFQLYFSLETEYTSIYEIFPPDFRKSDSAFAGFIGKHHFTFEERVAIALCLTGRFRPQSLDVFFTKNKTFDRRFVEFGGITKGNQGRFVPTGQTLIFLLAGSNIDQGMEAFNFLHRDHRLFRERILILQETELGQNHEDRILMLSPETESLLIWGESYRPEFNNQFPAKILHTQIEWEDLVLPVHTDVQVKEILLWLKHGETLLKDWGMEKKLRPGLRVLFHGPPGTGKTLTAALLGKVTQKPVYRVDLSLVVSKYIGETEKNLAKVFDMAEHRGWILFFDEADALFGKRTQVQDAHDRYANQEISYLLQRIESFDGIVILASNLRKNLDDAFSRRFESIILFPIPKPKERLMLWQKSFSDRAKKAFDDDVDLNKIAREYELAGGAIMNIVRQVSLQAIAQNRKIRQVDLIAGIRQEFGKEGRTI